MALALAHPRVTTVNHVAVTFVAIAFGPTDAQTVTLGYAPSDADGNLLMSATPAGEQIVVTLSAADVAAFLVHPGSLHARAHAALQSHLGDPLRGG